MYYCDMEAERFLNYKEEFFMMLRFRKMMAVLLAAALTLAILIPVCDGVEDMKAAKRDLAIIEIAMREKEDER